jgi:hypothetical protein
MLETQMFAIQVIVIAVVATEPAKKLSRPHVKHLLPVC